MPDGHTSWDMALLEFFASRLGGRVSQLLRPHLEFCRAAHCMIPRRKSCIVVDCPTRLELNGAGEIHSEHDTHPERYSFTSLGQIPAALRETLSVCILYI